MKNGTTTTYEYDPNSYRVTRIRTTRASDSKDLQDLLYWYDAVGNITLQKDNAWQPVFYANSVADPKNDYTYDTLYRLIQSEGRELAGNNGAVTNADAARSGNGNIPYPNNTSVPLTDAAAMRRYIQYYTYDEVGNMLSMQHTNTSGSGNWTRNFTIDSSSNQLTGSSIGSNGSSTDTYAYDARGNMTGGMNHLNAGSTSMLYNAENRLESVVITASITAYYQYDGSGQRVRKTIVNTAASITEKRIYVGEWELYTKFVSSSLTTKRESLHVSDDTGRILMIDSPLSPTTGESQLQRYTYSNHLGTATLELDDAAAIISYEEYYPFGSTSFQSGRSTAEVSLKRYRYTGKERDEETGLYYFGARYYASWLCRWVGSDALKAKYATLSSYNYCANNPIGNVDLDGNDIFVFTERTTTTTVTYGSKLGNDMSQTTSTKNLSYVIIKAPGENQFFYQKTNTNVDIRYNYDIETKKTTKTVHTTGERLTSVKEFFPLRKDIPSPSAAGGIADSPRYSSHITKTEVFGPLQHWDGDFISLAKLSNNALRKELIKSDSIYKQLENFEDSYKLGGVILTAYSIADLLVSGMPIGASVLKAWNASKAVEGGIIATEALNFKINEILKLSKSQQSEISTMVGGYNLKTGESAVGMKMRNSNPGMCAEDIVVQMLGGNKEDIIFTPAYRPRTGENIPVCERCQTKYNPQQFTEGTQFKR